jgi:hypothetical protein
MDEPTKHIVASNLAAAYCANHKELLDEKDIIEVYKRFVELLPPPPGKSAFTPGLDFG